MSPLLSREPMPLHRYYESLKGPPVVYTLFSGLSLCFDCAHGHDKEIEAALVERQNAHWTIVEVQQQATGRSCWQCGKLCLTVAYALRGVLEAAGTSLSEIAALIQEESVYCRLVRSAVGLEKLVPDLALALEKALGVPAGYWLYVQAEEDLARLRRREARNPGDRGS